MRPENEIHEAIDALRDSTESTQELYRETCALLFFRYGITPTANKLYQFVRKGSMSAPAEALARFWDDLREKSRIRIEHPDLPERIRTSAGELVGQLWSEAQSAARIEFDVFRHELEERMRASEAEAQGAQNQLDTAHRKHGDLVQTLREASERNLVLEREVATHQAENKALSRELTEIQKRYAALEQDSVSARRDFADELEKLRDALSSAEARFEGSQKRALLEIDRERTSNAKAQHELAQLREYAAKDRERHHEEVVALQRELGDARQQLGAAEEAISRLKDSALQQTSQIDTLREKLDHRSTELALVRRELNLCEEASKSSAKKTRRTATKGQQRTSKVSKSPGATKVGVSSNPEEKA